MFQRVHKLGRLLSCLLDQKPKVRIFSMGMHIMNGLSFLNYTAFTLFSKRNVPEQPAKLKGIDEILFPFRSHFTAEKGGFFQGSVCKSRNK